MNRAYKMRIKGSKGVQKYDEFKSKGTIIFSGSGMFKMDCRSK